jgi:hypothetical protein
MIFDKETTKTLINTFDLHFYAQGICFSNFCYFSAPSIWRNNVLGVIVILVLSNAGVLRVQEKTKVLQQGTVVNDVRQWI